ncbi:MAG TPA: hypothetical protein VLG71_03525 [Candidatus Limnocylindria bacterium]|nr:hypothetical protein [Candidatus Limnocylindria bacterium]
MNESPFTSFIELIRFDHSIATVEEALNKVKKELHAVRQQEEKQLATLEAAKKAAYDAQKAVDEQELAMAELVETEGKKKKRLENVTNHKEYQSIKAELEAVHAQQRTLEAELLEIWAALETAQKAHEATKKTVETTLEKVRTESALHESKQQSLEAELAEKRQQRPEKEQRVPQEWLDKYASMRASTLDPVVPVVHESCSACFYKVSEQDLLLLGRHKLLQCKGCYRFLYIESPQTLQS